MCRCVKSYSYHFHSRKLSWFGIHLSSIRRRRRRLNYLHLLRARLWAYDFWWTRLWLYVNWLSWRRLSRLYERKMKNEKIWKIEPFSLPIHSCSASTLRVCLLSAVKESTVFNVCLFFDFYYTLFFPSLHTIKMFRALHRVKEKICWQFIDWSTIRA